VDATVPEGVPIQASPNIRPWPTGWRRL